MEETDSYWNRTDMVKFIRLSTESKLGYFEFYFCNYTGLSS